MEIIPRFGMKRFYSGPISDTYIIESWASDKVLCARSLFRKMKCWNIQSLRSLQLSNHISSGFVLIILSLCPNSDTAEIPTWAALHIIEWAFLVDARRDNISSVTSSRAAPLDTDNYHRQWLHGGSEPEKRNGGKAWWPRILYLREH